jgi:hypothetical protein
MQLTSEEIEIKASKKWIYFHRKSDDLLIHKIKNVYDDRIGYRYEGYRKYSHSNPYVKDNKIYLTKTQSVGCGQSQTDEGREVSYPLPKDIIALLNK